MTREQIKALYEKENNFNRLVYRTIEYLIENNEVRVKYGRALSMRQGQNEESCVSHEIVSILNVKKGYFEDGYFHNTDKYLKLIKQVNESIEFLKDNKFIYVEQSVNSSYYYISGVNRRATK